jgi:hypothetical protein
MTTKKTTHKESTANKSAKVAKVAPAVIAQAEYRNQKND